MSEESGRPSRKLVWIIGGIFIALAIIFALNGLIRGGGEAVGIEDAAPGDTDARAVSPG